VKTINHVLAVDKAGPLTRLSHWLETESYKFLIPGSSIVITIWGVLDREDWHDYWWLAFIAFVFFIFGLYWTPRKPTYEVLKADYEHLQNRFKDRGRAVERALETLLQKLALHCNADTHHDRVSAYYYHAGEFVMVGRYSKNPDHRQEGRERYPVNQGVIGRAWGAVEGVYLKNFPAGRQRWVEKMTDDGFSEEETGELTMQSRTIAAFRIEDLNGSVGALVIETTEPKHIGAETLSKVQESLVYAAISDFIGGISPELPKAVNIGAGTPTSLFDDEWKLAADRPSHGGNGTVR